MARERLWKIIGVVGIIIGIAIALTPFNLAHVCGQATETKGQMHGAMRTMGETKADIKSAVNSAATTMGGILTPMRCNFMGTSEVFLGLLIAVNGLLIALAKHGRRNLALMLGVLGIAVILMPTGLGIGICSNNSMACHTTQAVLSIQGISLVSISLIGSLSRKLNFQAI